MKAKELAKASDSPGLITFAHYRQAAILAAYALVPVQKHVRDLEPRPSGSGVSTPLPDERGSTDLFLDGF